jgi:hypothetical protein
MRNLLVFVVSVLISLTQFFAPSVSAAQMPPPAEEEAEIQVSGLAKPKRASLNQFREALQAFAKHRKAMAPAGPLVFEIIPWEKSGVSTDNLDNVRLAFVSKTGRVPIAIDANHRFTLPDLSLLSDDYKLFSNVGKKPIIIFPRIYSPGTDLANRRLGDLRLECQVGWGFFKSEIPIFMRAGFGLVGGCASKRVVINNRLPKPIANVTITDGGKTAPIALNPKLPSSYRPPIYDKKLSNEARVRIVFK